MILTEKITEKVIRKKVASIKRNKKKTHLFFPHKEKFNNTLDLYGEYKRLHLLLF